MESCCTNCNCSEAERLDIALNEIKHIRGVTIMALQKAQEIYGWLPREAIEAVARALKLPTEEVYGVATFYSQFSLYPAGKNKVSVCMGTACYVKGAEKLLDRVSESLNIEVGQTTSDGFFSLIASRCVGCCGLAPVLMINDDVYGNLKEAQIAGILAKYKE